MADPKEREALTPQEQRIASQIRAEAMPSFTREDVMRACRTAAPYLNRKKNMVDTGFWLAVFSAMTATSALFWIVGALVLGLSARLAVDAFVNLEPTSLLIALSPVPILTLAIRELSCRGENLAQLERTCKYAPSRIYFARLWIGMLANAVAVAAVGAAMISTGSVTGRALCCSFIAMLLVGAAALAVMSHSSHAMPLSVLLVVWIVCSAFAAAQDEIVRAVEQLGMGALLAAAAGSGVVFGGSAFNASRRLYA